MASCNSGRLRSAQAAAPAAAAAVSVIAAPLPASWAAVARAMLEATAALVGHAIAGATVSSAPPLLASVEMGWERSPADGACESALLPACPVMLKARLSSCSVEGVAPPAGEAVVPGRIGVRLAPCSWASGSSAAKPSSWAGG